MSDDATPPSTQDATPETPDVPVDYIFRWDLDKTYLQTEFDKFRDLIRTAMQKPEDKRNVPGAIPLLRALAKQASADSRRAVYFISGSPQQMRQVLTRKLELDGITPEGFVLKPNLENLLRGRFRAIRAQVGYKLRALLEQQVKLSRVIPETLFGDDAEQDAVIYSIYAEIVAGRIQGDTLHELLQVAAVYPDNADAILELAAKIEPAERVKRIFINLDRKRPIQYFRPYMPRLIPVFNYFQAGLILFQDHLITLDDVVDISLYMIEHDHYNPFALANSFQDLLRRGRLDPSTIDDVVDGLRSNERARTRAPRVLAEFADRLSAIEGADLSSNVRHDEPVDYVSLLRYELEARRRHKAALKQRRPDSFFKRSKKS